ncbi:hypothetical protein V8B97DRAFT_1914455 [Scleroderma yunnanense]
MWCLMYWPPEVLIRGFRSLFVTNSELKMVKYDLQWTFEGHKGPINCASFMEDEGFLVTGTSANGTLVFWCFNVSLVLFEWIHMETVFDSAIEALELDKTHNLLAATTLGRIALYQVTKDKGAPLHLIWVIPPFSHPHYLTLPISVHFFDQGHSLMVTHLDSSYEAPHMDSEDTQLTMNKKEYFLSGTLWMDATYISSQTSTHTALFISTGLAVGLDKTAFAMSNLILMDAWLSLVVIMEKLCCGILSQESLYKSFTMGKVVTYHSPWHSKHVIASGSSDPGNSQLCIKIWSNEIDSLLKKADKDTSNRAVGAFLYMGCMVTVIAIILIDTCVYREMYHCVVSNVMLIKVFVVTG